MSEMVTSKIEYLHKVAIDVTAGTTADAEDIVNRPYRFEFIYGLGPAGLSPFEYRLADKSIGDRITLNVQLGEIDGVFEHLARMVCQIPELNGLAKFFVHCQIASVRNATSTEIVKAMATAAECGGCSCCGGHS